MLGCVRLLRLLTPIVLCTIFSVSLVCYFVFCDDPDPQSWSFIFSWSGITFHYIGTPFFSYCLVSLRIMCCASVRVDFLDTIQVWDPSLCLIYAYCDWSLLLESPLELDVWMLVKACLVVSISLW